ncbi:MAG: hypothetical protein MJY66_06835 [Bacteroidaceae bacterium]|nr:hypothetical protein [Bacteroidaceae bacterium]
MKKLFTLITMGVAMIVLASCHKDKNKVETITSPDKAQEYLAETGMQLANLIDEGLKANAETEELLVYLIGKYQDYDGSAVERFFDDVENGMRTETFTDNSAPNIPVRILQPMLDYAATGTRAAAVRTTERIITYSVSLPRFYCGIKADDAKGEFTVDPSVKDRLEITLYDQDSKPVTLTLKGSEKTTKASIISTIHENSFLDGEQTESHTRTNRRYFDIPENISLDIVHDGKTLAGAKVNSSLALDVNIEETEDEIVTNADGWYHYDYNDFYNDVTIDFTKLNIDGEITVDGGFTAKIGTDADSKGLNLNTSLNIGKQEVFSLGASLDGDLTLIDDFIKNADAVDDESAAFKMLSLLGYKADASLNVLDRVKVTIDCGNIGDLLEAIDKVDQAVYEGSGKKDVTAALSGLNAQLNSGLYLDGSDKQTAHLEFDCISDRDTRSGYSFEPVMVFEDGSRCNFEEFFTAKSFEEVAAAFSDIIEMLGGLLDDSSSLND